ncbi:DUF6114 domain-containing protein [Streptomonospora salina]|uniref:Uncharacterized protein n=1 Tax=Streptomonospora salina TaxID=104205 RepID=A0A841EAX7_9ACTN|nr:DUF6114 domain-containing protein [Streptomonospora salina]MBB5999604.1 hypothetical protein [Streptomonospora salina]
MTRNGTSRRWQTARAAFRQWRGSRPFWGGLLIVLSGAVIVAAPALNPLDLIVKQGVAGISGYFAGLLLMAVGVLAWLQPPQRFFYGIAAMLLALVSFVTSNFGGFVFGMLFGLVGGALTASWVPDRARAAASPGTSAPGRTRLAGLRGRRTGRGGGAAAAETAVQPADADAADESDTGSRDTSAAGTGPAGAGTDPAQGPDAPAQDSARDAPDTDSGEPRADGATYFTSPGSPSGDTAAGRRRRTGDGPAPGDSPGGGRMHSLAAVAAALVVAVPAPATVTWPWDDWFGGDESGEETSEPDPSPTPTASPTTPAPSGGPDGGGGGDGGGDGEAAGGQDGSAEDDGEDEGDEESETAEECSVQEGSSSMGEDEYRALLEACRQAKEDGQDPEFEVRQGDAPEGDGPWLAHTDPSGLDADSLSMSGAAFEGVVEYPVHGGTVRYLKLSMDTAELSGARQWAEHDGTTTSLGIPEMTMSGDVVMHVTRMKVRILGIPLEFTPDFPPPLLLPSMTVTDLEADQPLARAQTVTIAGLDEQVGD